MAQHTNAFPDLDRDLRFIPLGVDEPQHLSAEQIRRYNEGGHLFPIDVFSPSEVAEIRGYFDDLLAGALAAGWNNYEVVNWHMHCGGIWDIATDRRIIDVVSDLLGDTVILRHSHLFAKLPGDAKRVSWHQDASYWPLTPSRVVSAWLAIDDVDVDNSAMHVIPGSHHHAQLTFHDSEADENNVLFQTVPNAEHYGDAPVSRWRCGPGRCHCTATGSCTAPNRTGRTVAAAGWRCATSPATCAPTTAGTRTPSCAEASNPPATGPTIPAPTGNTSPPRTAARG